MTYREFEGEAYRMWEEIPPHFREGIDGLIVRPEAHAHPDHPDFYTMGVCETEPYPSGWSGPETTRSFLVLYHGSFVEVAREREDFPWEEELWETITHELRHHLEFLAEEDDLEELDHAMEESYKRWEGLAFDPWYYQYGTPLGAGTYRVEYDVYIEGRVSPDDRRGGGAVTFPWAGRLWAIEPPDPLGDLHYLRLRGEAFEPPEGEGVVELVLLRKRSFVERVRDFFWRRGLEIFEAEAEPVHIGEAPGSPGLNDGRPGRGAGGPPPGPESGSEGEGERDGRR